MTRDESRDRFGDFANKNFAVKTYSYLVPDTRSGPQDGLLTYYLSNETDIRTAGDGAEGSALIDGLFRMPSPSASVN